MEDFFLGGEGPLRPADAAAALILTPDQQYLMQLRDQRGGIFYPGHWGLFGGAVDPGETPEMALQRELTEELGLTAAGLEPLTETTLDFGRSGRVVRSFFVTHVDAAQLPRLVLNEGAAMRAFPARELLNGCRVVPYDAFAIWFHASRHFL